MKLEKWQALGNDYLIVEREELPWELTGPRIRRLCDSHFGLGSDGICEIAPADDPEAAASISIFNPDGSRAELSGNGIRQAALYLYSRGRVDSDEFLLETDAGAVRPRITSPTEARVEMGQASTASSGFPGGGPDGRGVIEAAGREWDFQHVSIGNPQCAIEVDDQLEALEIVAVGSVIERAEIFPERTNVSFWSTSGSGEGSEIRARIYERGVGETLSSGTGACGAAVAAHLGGLQSPIEVRLDGGSLKVEIDDQMGVHLTGWAVPVYQASLSEPLLEELTEETETPSLGSST